MGEARAGHARRRRLRLFEDGVAAFERTFPGDVARACPDAGALYVCPLCERGFPAAAIETGVLTEDHVPPRSQHGRMSVLVCKACNNKSGHRLEADMRRVENISDVLNGRRPEGHLVRIRMNDEGPRLNVLIRSRPGEMDIEVQPSLNSPVAQEQFQAEAHRLWESGSLDWQLNIEFNRDSFSVHKTRVGWLKSAYLVAFARFGYRYAFCRALAIVREQIGDDSKRLITLSGGVEPGDVEDNAIADINAPEHLRGAIGVRMGRNFVLLPGASSDTDFYPRLLRTRLRKGMNDVRLSGKTYEWPVGPSYSSDRLQQSAT